MFVSLRWKRERDVDGKAIESSLRTGMRLRTRIGCTSHAANQLANQPINQPANPLLATLSQSSMNLQLKSVFCREHLHNYGLVSPPHTYNTKKIVLKRKLKELQNKNYRTSEALCTGPNIALLGTGCSCLHGDGSAVLLELLVSCDGGKKTYSNVCINSHTLYSALTLCFFVSQNKTYIIRSSVSQHRIYKGMHWLHFSFELI